MNKKALEYLKAIKPQNLPDGMDVLKKGIEIGRTLDIKKSLFLEESGYSNWQEYKNKATENGEVLFEILLGLATLEEQIEAIKTIYEHGQRTGFNIRFVQVIPSALVALPKEYRENAPKPTSYTMETLDDWYAHQAGVPMQISFEDHHLGSPNAIEMTRNAIKAGSPRIGFVSQLIWAQPGYTNHKQHIIDVLTGIGMIAAKREDYVCVDTFLDDGMPGYAVDYVTFVGYSLLEYYIVHDLCGARWQVGYGNLVPQMVPRLAIALALHKLLYKKDEPVISYFNSTTITQWTHDIVSNYAPSSKEFLLEILFERKYKTGAMINPVSITEQLSVPTLQDLLDIYSVGSRMREDIEQWDELIDWTPVEKMADIFMEEGKRFFKNTLKVLEEAGVNTKDPLEMLMMIKNVDPSKFEFAFHHNVDEDGNVIPVEPTVMGQRTIEIKEKIIAELRGKGLNGTELKGKRMVIASGDGHSYGLSFMQSVLKAFGAEVVSGGVDVDAATLIDLADEEGVNIVGVSVHNGQGLDYAKQLKALTKKRSKEYHFFCGGMLNGILPGESEPSDISGLLNDMDVLATNDLYKEIKAIQKWS